MTREVFPHLVAWCFAPKASHGGLFLPINIPSLKKTMNRPDWLTVVFSGPLLRVRAGREGSPRQMGRKAQVARGRGPAARPRRGMLVTWLTIVTANPLAPARTCPGNMTHLCKRKHANCWESDSSVKYLWFCWGTFISNQPQFISPEPYCFRTEVTSKLKVVLSMMERGRKFLPSHQDTKAKLERGVGPEKNLNLDKWG